MAADKEFSRLGLLMAARLVRHGYVLATANLHVLLDYPLLEVAPAARFDELGAQA